MADYGGSAIVRPARGDYGDAPVVKPAANVWRKVNGEPATPVRYDRFGNGIDAEGNILERVTPVAPRPQTTAEAGYARAHPPTLTQGPNAAQRALSVPAAAMRTLADTVSGGFANKGAAVLEAIEHPEYGGTFAERYSAALNRQNQTSEATQVAHPVAAGVGTAAGVVTQGLAVPAKAIVLGSAGLGALNAAGHARGGLAEEAKQTAEGAVAGAVLGAGVKWGLSPGAVGRVADRFGPEAAAAVEATPPAVVLDAKGELTPEGQEIAARTGLHPDEVKGAYEEAAKPEPVAANENAPPAEPGAAQEPPSGAAPIEVPPAPQAAPASAPEAAPVAAPEAVAPTPLPATAAARVEQAASEGVNLSRAQATQDFAAQGEENTLRTAPTAEGQQVRDFFAAQQQQISEAVDRFKAAFGPEATAETRGQLVKDALTEMRNAGKAGVTALYQQAKGLGEGLGDNAKALMKLDTGPLVERMREIFVDEGIPEPVRKAVRQQAAKYGLIGVNPRTVEGTTSVHLLDEAGKPAETIRFRGPQLTLDLTNAEDLRQAINRLYQQDTTHTAQTLKPLIDDAVMQASERAATQGAGDFGAANATARAAHATQKATFDSGDVVTQIHRWKTGAPGVPALKPEDVIRTVFGSSPESVTNLRRVKAVLLGKPTEASRAAWKAIQAHGVAKVFEGAFTVSTKVTGETEGLISGLKLNSAINRFGTDKLRILLGEGDFNQLMKLRRIVADATIPIPGTTNPSGTAQKVIDFLSKSAGLVRHVPVVGPVVAFPVELARGGGELAAVGRRAGQVKTTLKGVTEFTPAAAAKADVKAGRAAKVSNIRRFLDAAGSDQFLAPFFAAAANAKERRP